MIIVRTPLRLPIAGGGTDIPVWYEKHGGMFISAEIDKYIYITYHRSKFDDRIRLRYSKMEEVSELDDVQHDIIKATLYTSRVKNRVELTSHAEIPSGTGLGSSGSFGVAILQAICPNRSKLFYAVESSRIQMKILKHPIGLQDQYVAAFGGINVYEIQKNSDVNITPISVQGLEDKLALFFTGFKRDAKEILSKFTVDGMDRIQELAWKVKNYLETGELDKYGKLLNEHWELKKKQPGMTNPKIDTWYEMGLKNGALGGKLVGAGGGGFLLFYTNDRKKLIESMPLLHVPFSWDFEGTKVILDD